MLAESINESYLGKLADPPKRVLIVDDERGILASLSHLLEYKYPEYLIGTAESAEEAYALIASTRVDVLITDYRLPNMSGLELVERTRKTSPETRSILITAYGASDMLHRAQKRGCVAYMEKPLDPDLLIQFIDEATHTKNTLRLEATQFSLPDIVQFLAMKKESAILLVSSSQNTGLLAIEQGTIVHAQFGGLSGADALLAIVDCPNAVITTINACVPEKRTLSVTWFALGALSEENSPDERIKLLENFQHDAEWNGRANRLSEKKTKAVLRDPDPDSDPVEQESKTGAQGFDPSQATLIDFTELFDTWEHKEVGKNLMCNEHGEESGLVRNLVNTGVQHFRNYRLEQAEECWNAALELDPECREAKDNLRVLDAVIELSDQDAVSLTEN